MPIAYAWPAGAQVLFFCTADHESGEYTVLHLKQLLRFLADPPEIEKLHILSLSRGTDVAMTALGGWQLEPVLIDILSEPRFYQ